MDVEVFNEVLLTASLCSSWKESVSTKNGGCTAKSIQSRQTSHSAASAKPAVITTFCHAQKLSKPYNAIKMTCWCVGEEKNILH